MYLECKYTGRHLREGDVVRIKTGTSSGTIGKVVGLRLISESPMVVQYYRGDKSILESYDCTSVEYIRHSGLVEVSPLPTLNKLLSDQELSEEHFTGGNVLGLRLSEDGTMLTFCPITRDIDLVKVLTEEGLEALIEQSFITRIPDQIHYGLSKTIDELIEHEYSPTEIVKKLVSLESC